jgi:hypothetical protein
LDAPHLLANYGCFAGSCLVGWVRVAFVVDFAAIRRLQIRITVTAQITKVMLLCFAHLDPEQNFFLGFSGEAYARQNDRAWDWRGLLLEKLIEPKLIRGSGK